MKVLIDQNISHRIIPKLQGYFEQLTHIREVGLMDSDDYQIFLYARQTQFDAILTLEEDFQHHILIHKAPPKVIWLRVGNCGTNYLAEVIVKNIADIEQFIHDEDFEIIEIF
jgi:predicted nuclease of predicted toxin-antitoxin system